MPGSIRIAADPVSTLDSFVTFRLGEQIYGLPVEPIVQIIPMLTITPLPEVGDPVAGVINVRGRVVPVVDLRRHVGLAEAPLRLHTPIILADVGHTTVGLIVDRMLDVLTVPRTEIISPESLLPEELIRPAVLHGLARVGDHLGLLLAPEHLFGAEEQHALVRAAELVARLEQAQPESAAPGDRVPPP